MRNQIARIFPEDVKGREDVRYMELQFCYKYGWNGGSIKKKFSGLLRHLNKVKMTEKCSYNGVIHQSSIRKIHKAGLVELVLSGSDKFLTSSTGLSILAERSIAKRYDGRPLAEKSFLAGLDHYNFPVVKRVDQASCSLEVSDSQDTRLTEIIMAKYAQENGCQYEKREIFNRNSLKLVGDIPSVLIFANGNLAQEYQNHLSFSQTDVWR